MNPNDQKVTVVLTILNEGDNLRSLLDALVNQTHPADEIVIVDGGSTDNTIEIIESYAADYPIRYFVEAGVNIAVGRNIAIERAEHDIIAVTDGGCLPAPAWLEALTKPLREDPDVGAVAGRLKAVATSRFEYFSGVLSMPKLEVEDETQMFYGRSSAFRRSVWKAAGGYPDWLYTAEDTLFSLRARSLGARIVYAPDSELAWRPRPTLRKLAKMFFLYGRGNGRIGYGSLRGTWYWLRNHSVWIAALFLGLVSHYFWIVAFAILVYIYFIMIAPVMRQVRHQTQSPLREIYVPVIVLTRNIASNLGYLYGCWERRTNPIFKQRLKAYGWSPEDPAGA